LETCLECSEHEIISDPDPHDWFCDDDVAVICKLTMNPNRDIKSIYISDQNEFRGVAISCRPHHLNLECIIPNWCPKFLSKESMNGDFKV